MTGRNIPRDSFPDEVLSLGDGSTPAYPLGDDRIIVEVSYT